MAGTDDEILRDYAQSRSADAFAEIVRRHAGWVFAAAFRQLRDRQLAEDVAQAVFLLLSHKPQKAVGRNLTGWLFQVMQYSVSNTMRSEARRRTHEANAAGLIAESVAADDPSVREQWEKLSPILEKSMERLRPIDRDAILLRFYQDKTFAEVGRELGISGEAARKRVMAALERLRDQLGARGVTSETAALSALLLAQAAQKAAPALIASITSTTPAASAVSLAAGVQKAMALAIMKTFAAVLSIVVLVSAVSTAAVLKIFHSSELASAPMPRTPAQPAISSAPSGVNFDVGHSQFASGDSITVTAITGPPGDIALGNHYKITGHYTLASQDAATLAVHVASNAQPLAHAPSDLYQIAIQKGAGDFTLDLDFNVSGYPHLSFYPAAGGSSFGMLYFGKGDSLQL